MRLSLRIGAEEHPHRLANVRQTPPPHLGLDIAIPQKQTAQRRTRHGKSITQRDKANSKMRHHASVHLTIE
jgi:hypothetical protein